MKFFRFNVFTFGFLLFFLFGVASSDARRSRPDEQPAPNIIRANTSDPISARGPLGSFQLIATSANFPGSAENLNSSVTSSLSVERDADIIDLIVRLIDEDIADKSVPNSQKGLLLTRYGVGDPRLVAAYLRAKAAGYAELVILTDLNQSLRVDWPEGTKLSNEFSDPLVKHKEGSPMTDTLEALLAAGFKYRTGANINAPFAISSVPLTDSMVSRKVPGDETGEERTLVENDAMGDLMHLKQFFTYRIQKKPVKGRVSAQRRGQRPTQEADAASAEEILAQATVQRIVRKFEFSTSNLVGPNERFNRSYVDLDPDIAQYALDHDFIFMSAMGKPETNEICDAPTRPALRKLYSLPQALVNHYSSRKITLSDDHLPYKQIAYTDGRYDLNQAIADQLVRMKESPANHKLALFVGSHFAPTHKAGADALIDLMEFDREAPVFFLSEHRFSTLRGWGRVASLLGFPVLRPRNIPSPRAVLTSALFDAEDRLRIRSFIWGKPTSDFASGGNYDPDEAPRKDHVLHDKTTMIFEQEDGVLVAYLRTGSFNWSGHYQSQEMQVTTRVPIAPMDDALLAQVRNEAKSEGTGAGASRVGKYDTLRRLMAAAGENALLEIFDSIINTAMVEKKSAPFGRFALFKDILGFLTGQVLHEQNDVEVRRVMELMTIKNQNATPTPVEPNPTESSSEGSSGVEARIASAAPKVAEVKGSQLATALLKMFESPSIMTAKYRPTEAGLLSNVTRIEQFMAWWASHRPGKPLSPYKTILACMPLAFGISEGPSAKMKGISAFQAKQILGTALGGPMGAPETQTALREIWDLWQMKFIDGNNALVPFPEWKPKGERASTAPAAVKHSPTRPRGEVECEADLSEIQESVPKPKGS